MTKAVMTAQPSGTITTRQQETEVDACDERYKLTKQTSVTSDTSPRRGIQKTLDRNPRRSATVVAQPSNTTEKDNSLSKKQQPRTPLTATQISELSQRLKRPTASKSIAGEPLTPINKLIGKEDSPPSASHSDSAKAKNGAQNRSYQLKTSEVPNADEPSSPPVVMYTSTGGIERGKPPKTPRSIRTTTSRSDAIALTRQTTTRAGDSEAISIPAATFAIKGGPQTVMSQWIVSLNDNLDDEGSDNQHSAKWEDAQEKLQRLEKYFIYKTILYFLSLFSTTHEPSQYHPAASSLSSPPVNQPQTPSNMNSQTTTAVNNFQSSIVHTTVLNSRQQQQQYHRSLLKTVDENINKGTINSSDAKESIVQPLTETLPFENYRTIDNKNYAGAKRTSNNDDEEGHEGDIDEENEDKHEQSKKKLNEQMISQQSRQLGDSFSRNFLSSTVQSNPNTSTILMMMKGNGGGGGSEHLGIGNQKSILKNGKSISSSSSSSLPVVDEHQQLKSRRYNFVPAPPLNGTRLIAKSTEQLPHSFDPQISILKQKYTPSATIIHSSSKIMHAYRKMILHASKLTLHVLFPFHHHQ
jgi:hypothetical protein